ncbi:zinc finger protein 324B-like, partial [Trichoplusia ni]|uniref:Zinc finger protein 324B-like n=1 Tax=Trichoplusia ni TaxID=7111 RepID=A0A7E5WRD5_TRINI
MYLQGDRSLTLYVIIIIPDPVLSLSRLVLPEVKVEQGASRGLTRVTEELEKPELSVGADGKKYALCGVCNKSVRASGWRRHARAHRGERRYSCHACGLAFADSGNLARHARALHAQLRPHACSTCRKAFSRRAHLREHERSHSERREFVCHECGAASKSGAALRMHARRHAAPALGCAQ